MILGELTIPLTRLTGIGPAALRDFEKLGITDVSKLLLHFPREYINRKDEVTLRLSIEKNLPANTVVEVIEHSFFMTSKGKILKLVVKDHLGTEAEIPCFNRNFLAKKFPPGCWVWLYGLCDFKYGNIQIPNFEIEQPPSDWKPGQALPAGAMLVPQYPLSGSLSQPQILKAMMQVFREYFTSVDEDIPLWIRKREGHLSLWEALKAIHFPDNFQILEKARNTLIYRELFHLQTVMTRRVIKKEKLRQALNFKKKLKAEFLVRLPFSLTPDQITSIEEIEKDLASEIPMARLLQGDVGSGKTLVAFISALIMIEAGFQCALMAPTELLAMQHAQNAAKLLDPLGVKVAFLTSNIRSAGRNKLLEELVLGKIDLVIGTHALFSEDVVYKNLRYAIIDEQHRFGVQQRQALFQKGNHPDMLYMTATPIPRTLAHTAFGDLTTSNIHSMPLGRKKIITHSAKMSNTQKVYEFIRFELTQGHRVYFVYPLIEASENLDLRDAQSMAKTLSDQIFPEYPVGLIHSRLEEMEKNNVMASFASGKIQILVATSVVEVGVDIPEATCMVIEHAERFGLSALHQLRGRVGRSDLQSYCFLVFDEPLTDDGKQRIKVLMENTDGFKIAEEDLKLRGPGDLMGMKQSGFMKLRIADLSVNLKVLDQAREDLLNIFTKDPYLLEATNAGMRQLWIKSPPFDENLVAL